MDIAAEEADIAAEATDLAVDLVAADVQVVVVVGAVAVEVPMHQLVLRHLHLRKLEAIGNEDTT